MSGELPAEYPWGSKWVNAGTPYIYIYTYLKHQSRDYLYYIYILCISWYYLYYIYILCISWIPKVCETIPPSRCFMCDALSPKAGTIYCACTVCIHTLHTSWIPRVWEIMAQSQQKEPKRLCVAYLFGFQVVWALLLSHGQFVPLGLKIAQTRIAYVLQ